MEKIKIAMLAPIAWRTPPRNYGPWELVASNLTEGLIKKEYDKTSGYTSATAKPIIKFVKPDEIKYFCRLIEQLFNKDLQLIIGIDSELKELRSYKNLMEHTKLYGQDNIANREKIEKYFDYITLDSLRINLIDLWDSIRKYLDDKTNEIIIPEPTIENREFFSYFLQSRDCYCEGNQEIALAIIRKAIEDILTKLWILHFEKLSDIDLNKKPKLDNLPGFLNGKGILQKQEFREVIAFIKYGNSGIHIIGEIPQKKLYENCKLMVNNGINFVNNLSKKYVKLMNQKNYCKIEFTKTGFSVGYGKISDYICKKSVEDLFEKEDIKEFEG